MARRNSVSIPIDGLIERFWVTDEEFIKIQTDKAFGQQFVKKATEVWRKKRETSTVVQPSLGQAPPVSSVIVTIPAPDRIGPVPSTSQGRPIPALGQSAPVSSVGVTTPSVTRGGPIPALGQTPSVSSVGVPIPSVTRGGSNPASDQGQPGASVGRMIQSVVQGGPIPAFGQVPPSSSRGGPIPSVTRGGPIPAVGRVPPATSVGRLIQSVAQCGPMPALGQPVELVSSGGGLVPAPGQVGPIPTVGRGVSSVHRGGSSSSARQRTEIPSPVRPVNSVGRGRGNPSVAGPPTGRGRCSGVRRAATDSGNQMRPGSLREMADYPRDDEGVDGDNFFDEFEEGEDADRQAEPAGVGGQERQEGLEEERFFNHERTLCLLASYKKFEDKFNNPCRLPYVLWRKVAADMESSGVRGVTGRMCSEKFKAMKNRYKAINKRLKQTGSGAPPTWPYYRHMSDILRNDPTINSNNIVEAGAAGYNRINRPQIFEDEDGDLESSTVNKRRRISNGDTIMLMLKTERERERTNAALLEFLGGFREHQVKQNKLLDKLIANDTIPDSTSGV